MKLKVENEGEEGALEGKEEEEEEQLEEEEMNDEQKNGNFIKW